MRHIRYNYCFAGHTPLAEKYTALAHGVSGVTIWHTYAPAAGSPAYHIFPILLPKTGKMDPIMMPVDNYRQLFMDGMKAHGVQTSIHYPPVHRFDLYRKQALHKKVELPIVFFPSYTI